MIWEYDMGFTPNYYVCAEQGWKINTYFKKYNSVLNFQIHYQVNTSRIHWCHAMRTSCFGIARLLLNTLNHASIKFCYYCQTSFISCIVLLFCWGRWIKRTTDSKSSHNQLDHQCQTHRVSGSDLSCDLRYEAKKSKYNNSIYL